MHPDNTHSQYHHKPMGQSGLARYGSAPGSLLNSAVDSVIGTDHEFSTHLSPLGSHYFSGDSSSITSESTCKVNSSNSAAPQEHKPKALRRSYGLNEIANRIGSASSCSSSSPSSLLRQRSSPADFLSHFVGADNNEGFTITREMGSYSSQVGTNDQGVSRLKSQMSFTNRHHDSLSHISEENHDVDHHVVKSNNSHQNAMLSYNNPPTSFGMDSWDNNTNSIVFSPPPGKRSKNMDGDIYDCLNLLESQYSLPQTSLEMATMERLLQVPEDSIPCKIRAKRGCATHPRSIAERERRTRISGKLKKLQELVPNMDKQTSYSDMLDLAVQHIKGLQNHVQKIEKELEHCTCGCNPTT